MVTFIYSVGQTLDGRNNLAKTLDGRNNLANLNYARLT
jgi:hypothetical protein